MGCMMMCMVQGQVEHAPLSDEFQAIMRSMISDNYQRSKRWFSRDHALKRKVSWFTDLY
jgi:hypothetical protein